MPDLKPCPKCGKQPREHHSMTPGVYHVHCLACKIYSYGQTAEEGRAAWNAGKSGLGEEWRKSWETR